MITEDYVSFETAKLLKEKGFQAKCTACYHSDPSHTLELVSGRINYCNPRFSKCKMIPPYNAPTLQMAMKWLREKKYIFIEVSVETAIKGAFAWRLFEYPSLEIMPYDGWENSPEDAAEAAIKYCLKNLI